MVYISFMELMPSAHAMLLGPWGEQGAKWILIAAFFGGMVLTGLIDRLIPEAENPHEVQALDAWEHSRSPQAAAPPRAEVLRRSAFLFMLAIGIHNFPEGIATMAAAFDNTGLATSVALAVAIHNIPEGVAVAVPLYCATGNRFKSFGWATLSGLAEPLGALVAMLILLPFLSPTLLAILFAAVAGVMVFISFDELLPMARRWGHHHLSIYGVMAGMLLMALVLYCTLYTKTDTRISCACRRFL